MKGLRVTALLLCQTKEADRGRSFIYNADEWKSGIIEQTNYSLGKMGILSILVLELESKKETISFSWNHKGTNLLNNYTMESIPQTEVGVENTLVVQFTWNNLALNNGCLEGALLRFVNDDSLHMLVIQVITPEEVRETVLKKELSDGTLRASFAKTKPVT